MIFTHRAHCPAIVAGLFLKVFALKTAGSAVFRNFSRRPRHFSRDPGGFPGRFFSDDEFSAGEIPRLYTRMQRDVIEPAVGFFPHLILERAFFRGSKIWNFIRANHVSFYMGVGMHGFMALTISQWKLCMDVMCELLFSKVVVMKMISNILCIII